MSADHLDWVEGGVAAQLGDLDAAGLRRRLRLLQRDSVGLVTLDGGTVVNFSSNDYLGLAVSDQLKQAMVEAVSRHGVGSGASRLVCGNMECHEALEAALAEFKGTEAALSFSTGHAVAVGVLPALCGAGDTIVLDKLSHASLIDGARLSGATLRIFPHNNLEKLERMLVAIRAKNAKGRILVVTESVFSMDGDAAPLAALVELKDRHGAWLLVDEAHAFGILGPQGRGLVAGLRLEKRVELQMGTLSKAAGVSGGYVAASREVIDLLINRARSLIYSTAPPPAVAATAAAAVAMIGGGEGDRRRERLWANRAHLLSLLPELDADLVMAAIVPVMIGGEREAVAAAEQLMEAGFFAPAIRYPTVARSQARLRVTLSALHELVEIEGLVGCLRRHMV
ncbi:aminotransferase class I/II-fold pyridoxal phosphate-dependent enzyme [Phragmitibacter flavus]|nr:8-amino-7-oxononanoate synthase [Phragmitibacter flavus]